MENIVNNLKEIFKNSNLELSDYQAEQFIKYKDILLEYNKVMNLTAITEEEDVYVKHFLDSVLPVLTGYIENGMNIIDVGCGAGFPSIPIKIYMPDTKFTLLDSLNKRINFLNEVIKYTDLKDVITVHSRAEDGGRDGNLREKFDVCVARAVAPLNILLEYCTPFVRPGGYFIALKGREAEEETENAKNAMSELKVKLCDTLNTTLHNTDNQRNILVFKKIANTPKQYPRNAGKPKKSPL